MTKFYICERCGNLVEKHENSGVALVCCGQKMSELAAGTTDASREKHIPVAQVCDGSVTVSVGSVMHPMTEEHLISWVYLETDRGSYKRSFKAGDTPSVTFLLSKEKPIAVYAWCNLHGLWRLDL